MRPQSTIHSIQWSAYAPTFLGLGLHSAGRAHDMLDSGLYVAMQVRIMHGSVSWLHQDLYVRSHRLLARVTEGLLGIAVVKRCRSISIRQARLDPQCQPEAAHKHSHVEFLDNSRGVYQDHRAACILENSLKDDDVVEAVEESRRAEVVADYRHNTQTYTHTHTHTHKHTNVHTSLISAAAFCSVMSVKIPMNSPDESSFTCNLGTPYQCQVRCSMSAQSKRSSRHSQARPPISGFGDYRHLPDGLGWRGVEHQNTGNRYSSCRGKLSTSLSPRCV
jgi:hypothetical protein